MQLKRFSEMRRQDARVDLHMHSTYTDGQGTIEEIVVRAVQLGLTAVAITDHVRAQSRFVPTYFDHIDRLGGAADVKILKGLEAKIGDFNGHIDARPEDCTRADIVVGSVHRFPLGRRLYAAEHFSKDVSQAIELELARAAVCARECDVLGHPGGMSLRTHGAFPLEFFEELIIACRENDVAFELNSSYHAAIVGELVALLRKHDPLISLGSDAHELARIGENWILWSDLFHE